MLTRHRNGIAALVVLLLLGASSLAPAQSSVRDSLFREADASLGKAREAGADLLAPRSFDRGMDYYNDASDHFERGRDLATIQADLSSAIEHFERAREATARAGVAMGALIKTRSDAEAAGAPTYATELWEKAENKLRDIAIDNERGREAAVQRMTPSAEAAYRSAELAAIKANYLSDARRLLDEADEKRVGRYAPRTLAAAEASLAQAEQELTENRYDTDLPRSLARQAQYQARHAIYLAGQLQKHRKDKKTNEDLVLEWQKPIARIAGSADLVARFDEGPDVPTQAVVEHILALQTANRELTQELNDRDLQIARMTEQVESLERQLGGVSQERVALSLQLERQAMARQRYAQLESMFSQREAQVLRDGKLIILRMIGLGFDSGKSDIRENSAALLGKVIDAFDLYRGSNIVIEGHTDSYGSDTVNLRLSEARAEAVRDYLLANAEVDESLISSIGYGETRPIANNETQEGRSRNRRIDIAIVPADDAF